MSGIAFSFHSYDEKKTERQSSCWFDTVYFFKKK
jgi:hypothetical protein